MGCCCAKDKDEQEDSNERTRLLGNNDLNQKSRFVDSNAAQNNLNGIAINNQNYQRSNPNTANNLDNNAGINGNQSNDGTNGANANNNYNESNQMFEKILSEVIHVDPRVNISNDISSHNVQEMPLKIKGLLEPTKQHLTLPEGVPAPVTVLSAQPPFTSDIRLINNLAFEAQNCINNFSLQVPENVAFDFNPVV